MLNRLRDWVFSEHSWPLLLLATLIVYWLVPQERWIVVLFMSLSMIYLAWGLAWIGEYWKIQRIAARLLIAIANLFSAGALLIGSLILLRPEGFDVEQLRLVSRICWLINYLPLSIAVYRDCWRIGKILWHKWKR